MVDQLEKRYLRMKESGKILRYLRKKAGLSQKQIAEKLNIVQSTYAGYENGHHEPIIDFLIQLAEFHGVTLDFISGHVFDGWLVTPFKAYSKEDYQSIDDLHEHAQRQYKDMERFSDMVMEARMHGEYSTYKDLAFEYRDDIRKEIE